MGDLDSLSGRAPTPAGVVVPEPLREVVWRGLASEIRRARLVDGSTSVRPDLLAFLEALRGAGRDAASMSANGSAVAASGTVWMTTNDVARELGCTDRHARRVVVSIGTRVGRQWLVDRTAFDTWRTT